MIAVTGAAGFIGSNLATAARGAEGYPLLLVDPDITAAKAANLVGLSRFAFSRHDHFLDDLAAGRACGRIRSFISARAAATPRRTGTTSSVTTSEYARAALGLVRGPWQAAALRFERVGDLRRRAAWLRRPHRARPISRR